jgi:hypothetical protein
MNPLIRGAEQVRRVLDHLNKVQDTHRQFKVAASDAGMYGIGLLDLEAWTAMGLSVQRTDRGEFFDPDDLYNLSLHLRLPSLHKLAMRGWAAAFRNSEHDRSIRLSYSLTDDPPPAHAVDVLTPSGLHRMALSSEKDFFHTTVRTVGRRILMPAPIAALIDETMHGVQFYMLHDPIRWSSPFILQHRLTECGGLSKLLVEMARIQGLEARQVFGLLLSRPYATGHYWSEFRIDGEWLAADPLMIRLLSQHAGLSPADWPEHRSPAGALLRLAVINGYDCVGAPYLDCFATKRFRQYAVVTNEADCYRTSYAVAD